MSIQTSPPSADRRKPVSGYTETGFGRGKNISANCILLLNGNGSVSDGFCGQILHPERTQQQVWSDGRRVEQSLITCSPEKYAR